MIPTTRYENSAAPPEASSKSSHLTPQLNRISFVTATRRKLESVAAEVAILGPQLYQLGDDLPEMVSSAVTSYPNESVANDFMSSLTNALYLKHYCGLSRPMTSAGTGADLFRGLQDANTSVEGWDCGWEIVNRDTFGRAVVRSGTRTRLVPIQEVRGRAETERIDGPVIIRRSREDFSSQPGYYYALGEALGDQYEDQVGARIYLNLTAAAATPWMNSVTRALNGYRVPFQFKVLRHAPAFARLDAGILYVPRRHAGFTCSLVVELAQTVGGLGNRTPLFTRRIGPGISLADNPPGGGSFGLNRMKLVAEGYLDVWTGSKTSIPRVVQSVALRFRRAGLDPQRPWLNAGNSEVVLQRSVRRAPASSGCKSTPWLEVSNRIGAKLIRDAFWHGNRCTWLGWALVADTAGFKPAVCTVGGDLYSGTAGIAVFLARLWAVTRDPRQHAGAVGALRHAIDQTRHGHWRIGAYSGLGGILHAAVTVAEACQCDEAGTAMVQSLIERLSSSSPEDTELDILDGRAGAVRALLFAAERKLDRHGLALQAAVRFGGEIIRLAKRRREKWSWNTTKTPVTGHLLGYSHGTSGIACALEDLHRATGERAFQRAARAAWRYEASWFDERAGNWPDFRGEVAATASSSWCHGAPGTGLALARHLALDAKIGSQLGPLLAASVKTTLANLESQNRDSQGASFCLCHGIAGNADILLQIAQLAGRTDARAAVLAAAHAGMERHHDAGNWPCGVPGGDETPALLLGLAGIGHFYLRLHDDSVPSALLL